MTTETDRELLTKLFADEQAGFRHQMSLSRSSAEVFYASSTAAAEIREEKRAILDSPAADLHLLETDAGKAAFGEFVQTVGGVMGDVDPESDGKSLHRAVTLSLEPDWMLMAPEPWKLVWASVCFPTRWSLAGKAWQPLAAIHGAVPGLNEELGRKIDVFFDRLVPGAGWARANWGLSTNANRNQHPSLPYAPLSDGTPPGEVSVRVESQHVLKLPGTGAIAFGIRILSFPLAEVVAEPGVAAGLKERLRTMPAEVSAYKGIPADFWQRL